MIICEYCLQEILSRGNAVMIRNYEPETDEETHVCDWCGDLVEVSELLDVI